MFYKKTVLSLAVLGLILGGGLLATNAYQGDSTVTGPNYSPERHTAVVEALTNQDYAAWQTAMAGRPITDKINAENFTKFAEAWQLGQAGNHDEARAIRQELDLGKGNMFRRGDKLSGDHPEMGKHMMQRGARLGGNFTDTDGNGVCDNLDLDQ